MDIRFLYYEDCLSHDEALARLREVLDEEGIDAKLEILKVETPEQAETLRFLGSPTIQINGRDMDPREKPRFGLACRAYRLEDGRISPLPSKEMIRKALRATS